MYFTCGLSELNLATEVDVLKKLHLMYTWMGRSDSGCSGITLSQHGGELQESEMPGERRIID